MKKQKSVKLPVMGLYGNMESAHFNNHQLKFDIEKIRSFDEINITIGYDENLDHPFILDINDYTYFYINQLERDNDCKLFNFIFCI